MNCPKCQCKEISASGMCLWCGYQVIEPSVEPKPEGEREDAGPAETEDAQPQDAEVQEELPAWRQELSQRLQSVKQKRETAGGSEPAKSAPSVAEEKSQDLEQADPVQSEPKPAAQPYAPIRMEPQKPQTESRESKTLEDKEIPAAESGSEAAKPGSIRELIDSRISQASQPSTSQADVEELLFRANANLHRKESRMILMVRTLSGVVDVIIMALITGILIIAADVFSGIKVLDFRSILHYSALLLLVYFLYSLFFLLTINQTIGMMITNLRVTEGGDNKRPHAPRILARCFGFLLSILLLGIGLLWALFDEEHLCLHDKLTNTRVVPIYSTFA